MQQNNTLENDFTLEREKQAPSQEPSARSSRWYQSLLSSVGNLFMTLLVKKKCESDFNQCMTLIKAFLGGGSCFPKTTVKLQEKLLPGTASLAHIHRVWTEVQGKVLFSPLPSTRGLQIYRILMRHDKFLML